MENIKCFSGYCCGCAQCASVCPEQAIRMNPNEQGFLFPEIDDQKCVHCGLCVEQCAFNKRVTSLKPSNQIEAYAVKHKDDTVRYASRSGGVFSAITDEFLDNNGVVYGCKLVDLTKAVHGRATTKEERDQFRGSKYIQSDISGCFHSIQEDLKAGKPVLFSGTACQVDAVKTYCNHIDSSNLYLIDIVCYGVPSPRVWADFLTYLSKGHKRIVKADFRDKMRFGWSSHVESIEFADGSIYCGEVFKKLFSSRCILRESCFYCPYKNLDRVGDITIADCWGIAQNRPDFDDDKGVSLVIINTEKGRRLFRKCESSLEYIQIEIEDYLQPCLKENWEKPKEYESFWNYYKKHSFRSVIKKYTDNYSNTNYWYIPNCVSRILKLINRMIGDNR